VRVSNRQHVHAALALRVYVLDTASGPQPPVERVVHRNDRVLVTRRVELLYVTVFAYLCATNMQTQSIRSCLLIIGKANKVIYF